VGPKFFHAEEQMNLIFAFPLLQRCLERDRESTLNQTHALLFINNTKMKDSENMADVLNYLFMTY
jgi:hypothetical protein